MPVCERAPRVCVRTCVRACVRSCVRVRACVQVSTGPQPKPPKAELPESQWCTAKKNALTVNLAR